MTTGTIVCFLLILSLPIVQGLEQQTNQPPNDSKQNKLESPKHPLLITLVKAMMTFRLQRFLFLLSVSTEPTDDGTSFTITHPILFLRSAMLFFKINICAYYWLTLSAKLGWGWTLDDIAPYYYQLIIHQSTMDNWFKATETPLLRIDTLKIGGIVGFYH